MIIEFTLEAFAMHVWECRKIGGKTAEMANSLLAEQPPHIIHAVQDYIRGVDETIVGPAKDIWARASTIGG